ncbi:hypothetical protein CXF85_04455 [Colwellia sp. 75C3]|uniref:hypothetical protein n=1 Tax=Colwellia sp. 75C3 TaxID=888425 RepID=UPI000C32CC86|nr:hypothetical protein [Colwellia sp. 75C3]PKG86028.1 hypothetical protein CXF85_04455 [Colwellia sp. 75C3]
MCSTPRPKTKVKGKAGTDGSLLSNLSAEARNSFAKRANVAQERRYQMAMKLEQAKYQRDASIKTTKKIENRTVSKPNRNLSYWLLNANLKEILIMLFFGTSRRT